MTQDMNLTPQDQSSQLAETILQRLEWLYQNVGNDDQAEQIMAVAQELQQVHAITDERIRGLMAMVNDATAQRDEVRDALEALVHDLEVDPFGSDNPAIDDLIERVRDSEYHAAFEHYDERFEEWKREEFERLVDDAEEYGAEAARDMMAEQIATVLDVTTYEGYDVIELLTGDSLDDLNEEEQREFNAFVERVMQRNRRERMRQRGESS